MVGGGGVGPPPFSGFILRPRSFLYEHDLLGTAAAFSVARVVVADASNGRSKPRRMYSTYVARSDLHLSMSPVRIVMS